MINKNIKKPFGMSKSVSLFLVFTFTFSNLGIADLAALAPISAEAKLQPLSYQIEIPETYGIISERTIPAQNSGTIVHIQDAHASLEAQEHIRQTLHYLKDQFGLDFVLVEGAMGELRADQLLAFPEESLNQELAGLLVKRGVLSGSERFLLDDSGKDGAKMFGVEDGKLYSNNLASFREVISRRSESAKFLDSLKVLIMTESSRSMNPKLQKFFREWALLQDRSSEILRQLETLKKYASAIHVDFSRPESQIQWPHLTRVYKLSDLEKRVDVKKVPQDLTALQAWFKAHPMTGNAADEVRGYTIEKGFPHKPESGTRALLESFYSEARKSGFTFTAYPSLSQLWGRAILREEIDASLLFDEISALTAQITDALAVSEKEKKTIETYRDYLLLAKLLKLELLDEEYTRVLERRAAILPSRLLSAVQNGKTFSADPQDKLFETALHFYKDAKARDQVMFERMISRMKASGEAGAVIVSGGFHSEGLQARAKEKGLGYVEIQPRISDLAQSADYEKAMLLEGAPTAEGNDAQNASFPRALTDSLAEAPYITYAREILGLSRREIAAKYGKPELAGSSRFENRLEAGQISVNGILRPEKMTGEMTIDAALQALSISPSHITHLFLSGGERDMEVMQFSRSYGNSKIDFYHRGLKIESPVIAFLEFLREHSLRAEGVTEQPRQIFVTPKPSANFDAEAFALAIRGLERLGFKYVGSGDESDSTAILFDPTGIITGTLLRADARSEDRIADFRSYLTEHSFTAQPDSNKPGQIIVRKSGIFSKEFDAPLITAIADRFGLFFTGWSGPEQSTALFFDQDQSIYQSLPRSERRPGFEKIDALLKSNPILPNRGTRLTDRIEGAPAEIEYDAATASAIEQAIDSKQRFHLQLKHIRGLRYGLVIVPGAGIIVPKDSAGRVIDSILKENEGVLASQGINTKVDGWFNKLEVQAVPDGKQEPETFIGQPALGMTAVAGGQTLVIKIPRVQSEQTSSEMQRFQEAVDTLDAILSGKITAPRVLIADKLEKLDEILKLEGRGDIRVVRKDEIGRGKDAAWLLETIQKEQPDVLLIRSDSKVTPEVLAALNAPGRKRPAVVLRVGADTNNIDTAKAKELGVIVARTHGNQNSVANVALRFLFSFQSFIHPKEFTTATDFSDVPVINRILDVPVYEMAQAVQESTRKGRGALPDAQQSELFSSRTFAGSPKTIFQNTRLALVGFGVIPNVIGEKMTALAAAVNASLPPIMVWTRTVEDRAQGGKGAPAIQAAGFTPAQKAKILNEANVISLHLPGSAQTFLDAAALKVLEARKDGPIAIINTARLKNVDHDALLAAMKAKNDLYYFADIDLTADGQDIPSLKALREAFPGRAFLVPHIAASTANAGVQTEKNTIAGLREISAVFGAQTAYSEAKLDFVVRPRSEMREWTAIESTAAWLEPVFESIGLASPKAEWMPLTGDMPADILQKDAAYLAPSSALQAMGAGVLKGGGKSVKEQADGQAVYLGEAALKALVQADSKKAVAIFGDEGARDDSFSLKMGRIYHKSYENGYKDYEVIRIEEDGDGKEKEVVQAEALKAFYQEIERLENAGVVVGGQLGDALDGTNNLAGGKSGAVSVQALSRRFILNSDSFRVAATTYSTAAEQEIEIDPLDDLPSDVFLKLAKAEGVNLEDVINNAVVAFLGPRPKGEKKAVEAHTGSEDPWAGHRHERFWRDVSALQKKYPGLIAATPGDGDVLYRAIAGIGASLEFGNGRTKRLFVFGRSGAQEAISTLTAAANSTAGRMAYYFVSPSATDSHGVSREHAFRFSEGEDELLRLIDSHQHDTRYEAVKGSNGDQGVLAVTPVTDVPAEFVGQALAENLQAVQFLEDGHVITHTLLSTPQGAGIIRLTFQARTSTADVKEKILAIGQKLMQPAAKAGAVETKLKRYDDTQPVSARTYSNFLVLSAMTAAEAVAEIIRLENEAGHLITSKNVTGLRIQERGEKETQTISPDASLLLKPDTLITASFTLSENRNSLEKLLVSSSPEQVSYQLRMLEYGRDTLQLTEAMELIREDLKVSEPTRSILVNGESVRAGEVARTKIKQGDIVTAVFVNAPSSAAKQTVLMPELLAVFEKKVQAIQTRIGLDIDAGYSYPNDNFREAVTAAYSTLLPEISRIITENSVNQADSLTVPPGVSQFVRDRLKEFTTSLETARSGWQNLPQARENWAQLVFAVRDIHDLIAQIDYYTAILSRSEARQTRSEMLTQLLSDPATVNQAEAENLFARIGAADQGLAADLQKLSRESKVDWVLALAAEALKRLGVTEKLEEAVPAKVTVPEELKTLEDLRIYLKRALVDSSIPFPRINDGLIELIAPGDTSFISGLKRLIAVFNPDEKVFAIQALQRIGADAVMQVDARVIGLIKGLAENPQTNPVVAAAAQKFMVDVPPPDEPKDELSPLSTDDQDFFNGLTFGNNDTTPRHETRIPEPEVPRRSVLAAGIAGLAALSLPRGTQAGENIFFTFDKKASPAQRALDLRNLRDSLKQKKLSDLEYRLLLGELNNFLAASMDRVQNVHVGAEILEAKRGVRTAALEPDIKTRAARYAEKLDVIKREFLSAFNAEVPVRDVLAEILQRVIADTSDPDTQIFAAGLFSRVIGSAELDFKYFQQKIYGDIIVTDENRVLLTAVQKTLVPTQKQKDLYEQVAAALKPLGDQVNEQAASLKQEVEQAEADKASLKKTVDALDYNIGDINQKITAEELKLDGPKGKSRPGVSTSLGLRQRRTKLRADGVAKNLDEIERISKEIAVVEARILSLEFSRQEEAVKRTRAKNDISVLERTLPSRKVRLKDAQRRAEDIQNFLAAFTLFIKRSEARDEVHRGGFNFVEVAKGSIVETRAQGEVAGLVRKTIGEKPGTYRLIIFSPDKDLSRPERFWWIPVPENLLAKISEWLQPLLQKASSIAPDVQLDVVSAFYQLTPQRLEELKDVAGIQEKGGALLITPFLTTPDDQFPAGPGGGGIPRPVGPTDRSNLVALNPVVGQPPVRPFADTTAPQEIFAGTANRAPRSEQRTLTAEVEAVYRDVAEKTLPIIWSKQDVERALTALENARLQEENSGRQRFEEILAANLGDYKGLAGPSRAGRAVHLVLPVDASVPVQRMKLLVAALADKGDTIQVLLQGEGVTINQAKDYEYQLHQSISRMGLMDQSNQIRVIAAGSQRDLLRQSRRFIGDRSREGDRGIADQDAELLNEVGQIADGLRLLIPADIKEETVIALLAMAFLRDAAKEATPGVMSVKAWMEKKGINAQSLSERIRLAAEALERFTSAA